MTGDYVQSRDPKKKKEIVVNETTFAVRKAVLANFTRDTNCPLFVNSYELVTTRSSGHRIEIDRVILRSVTFYNTRNRGELRQSKSIKSRKYRAC